MASAGYDDMSDARDRAVTTICVTGCVLFSLLLALALWRSTVHHRAAPGWSSRKLFHLCITVLSAFKLSEFVFMWRFGNLLERSRSMGGRLVYGLHLLCYWLQLCALSIVVTLWAGALRQERRHRPAVASGSAVLPTSGATGGAKQTLRARVHSCMHNRRAIVRFLVTLDSLVLLYTIMVVIFIAKEPAGRSIVEVTKGKEWYSAFGWVAGLALLFTACGILFYGLSITARIIFRSGPDPNYYSLKLRRMVWRLNTSMAVCCSAFALRCFLLVFYAIKGEAYINRTLTELDWFIMIDWIPSIVPSVVLLYLMRRPDSSGRNRAQPTPAQSESSRPITSPSTSSTTRSLDRESAGESLRQPLIEDGVSAKVEGP